MKRDLSQFENSDFERGASRLKEALWWLVRSGLFLPSLPLPSVLRVRALRLFGAQMGEGVVIRSGVNITFPWRFECGDHVWIGERVQILSLAKVKLGSNVCVSQEAYLCTGSHEHREASFGLITKEICLQDGSWVGARALICLLYTSPSPRDQRGSRMPSSA